MRSRTFWDAMVHVWNDVPLRTVLMALVMLASVGLEPFGLALGGIVASCNVGLLFWGAGALIALTGVAVQ